MNAPRLPELLRFESGEPVTGREAWPARREEILSLLSREMFGVTPPPCPARPIPSEEGSREDAFAGKAVTRVCEVELDTPGGPFRYPMILVTPHKPRALILHISFHGTDANRYSPTEEIIDEGFALASIDYNAVTRDDGDFSDGIAAMFPREGDGAWGKIGMWAYAASRALDCLLGMEEYAALKVAVIGHSRLGKTALWCGANDERISFVIDNESGCSGSAISRGKRGETIADITRVFPYWFAPRYAAYANREEELPFDQHFLLAACAPRRLFVGAALGDVWADHRAMYLGCKEASPAWELFGEAGLIGPERPPEEPACYPDGAVGFQLRPGAHFLSRYDWRKAMEYMEGVL